MDFNEALRILKLKNNIFTIVELVCAYIKEVFKLKQNERYIEAEKVQEAYKLLEGYAEDSPQIRNQEVLDLLEQGMKYLRLLIDLMKNNHQNDLVFGEICDTYFNLVSQVTSISDLNLLQERFEQHVTDYFESDKDSILLSKLSKICERIDINSERLEEILFDIPERYEKYCLLRKKFDDVVSRVEVSPRELDITLLDQLQFRETKKSQEHDEKILDTVFKFTTPLYINRTTGDIFLIRTVNDQIMAYNITDKRKKNVDFAILLSDKTFNDYFVSFHEFFDNATCCINKKVFRVYSESTHLPEITDAFYVPYYFYNDIMLYMRPNWKLWHEDHRLEFKTSTINGEYGGTWEVESEDIEQIDENTVTPDTCYLQLFDNYSAIIEYAELFISADSIKEKR